MYKEFYQLNTRHELNEFFAAYLPLVQLALKQFGVSKDRFQLEIDHLGIQVSSGQEFDLVHNSLFTYSTVVNSGIIHGRRNNLYRLNEPIEIDGLILPYLEIFEPKADADVYRLKLGIEHISYYSSRFDELLTHFVENRVPIAKQVDMHGSKFLKTVFMNLVEIEFRNDFLYQAIELEKKIAK